MPKGRPLLEREPKRVDHGTPRWFFDPLNEEFKFTLDACANAGNAKVERFYDEEQNGLRQPWDGTVWVNPPGYDVKTVSSWIMKAVIEFELGGCKRVVMLLPAKTDVGWWHSLVMPLASEVRFVKGRIKFDGESAPALFASAVVVFDGAPPADGPRYSSYKVENGTKRRRGRKKAGS